MKIVNALLSLVLFASAACSPGESANALAVASSASNDEVAAPATRQPSPDTTGGAALTPTDPHAGLGAQPTTGTNGATVVAQSDPHAGHGAQPSPGTTGGAAPAQADPHAGHGDHADHGDGATAPPVVPGAATEGSGASAEHTAHEEMAHGLEPGQYDPAELVAQPGAAAGDLTACPVSGEVFRIDGDAPHVTHEGQEVYFCCPRCIRNFQRDPSRYLTP